MLPAWSASTTRPTLALPSRSPSALPASLLSQHPRRPLMTFREDGECEAHMKATVRSLIVPRLTGSASGAGPALTLPYSRHGRAATPRSTEDSSGPPPGSRRARPLAAATFAGLHDSIEQDCAPGLTCLSWDGRMPARARFEPSRAKARHRDHKPEPRAERSAVQCRRRPAHSDRLVDNSIYIDRRVLGKVLREEPCQALKALTWSSSSRSFRVPHGAPAARARPTTKPSALANSRTPRWSSR